MDACNKMTKEQALKEMELFKAVFDGGRLIDAHALRRRDLVPIPNRKLVKALISGRRSIHVRMIAVLCCRRSGTGLSIQNLNILNQSFMK